MFLALDTTQLPATLALACPASQTIIEKEVPATVSLAEHLIPSIDSFCQENAISPNTIKAILINRGPGLFTGIRAGLSTAIGISLARQIPLYGIEAPCLQALLYRHSLHQQTLHAPLAVAIPSTATHLFMQVFDENLKTLHPLQEINNDDFPALQKSLPSNTLYLGSSWQNFLKEEHYFFTTPLTAKNICTVFLQSFENSAIQETALAPFWHLNTAVTPVYGKESYATRPAQALR